MSPRDALYEYFELDPAIKDLPNAINDALANGPGERLRQVHGGLPSTLRYTVAVSAISFFAVKRLVFPTHVDEDPRPHWATAIPPLARTFIDAIVNVVYLSESPHDRVGRFIKAGVCKELSRHRRLSTLHAGDPSWEGPLAQLKEWIDGTEALAPLSDAERASLDQSARRLWPNPGQLVSQCSSDAKRYLSFLKDWHYDELSQDSHLSYMGLVRRGQMLNEALVGVPQEEYRTRTFYAALALYVALLSEVAAAANLTAESRQLEVVWGKLVGIGDADVLWRERYKSLLEAII